MAIGRTNACGSSGLAINGVIEQYKVKAGSSVSAGDFVQFINDWNTPIVGTDAPLNSEIAHSGECISAVLLDSTHVFIAHSYTNQHLYGMVCTINGTTITPGMDTALSATTPTAYKKISAVLIDSTHVFIAYGYNASSTWFLYGMVCTISGTSVTPGTETALNNTVINTGAYISVALIDSTHVFIAYGYGSNYYLYGMVCTIDETTITPGVETALNGIDLYTGCNIDVVLLDSTHVFIAHNYGSDNYLYGMVCTINGTTITPGMDTALSETSAYICNSLGVVLIDKAHVLIAHSFCTAGNYEYYLYGLICSEGELVESYTDAINGIAKTAGAAGEAVDVYVPAV